MSELEEENEEVYVEEEDTPMEGTVVSHGPINFYIDKRLSLGLDRVIKRVKNKDEDFFWAIDGEEGSGKSVLAFQLAKYVDPSFSVERIVFNSKEFQEAVLKADKGQAIVFDEAFRGLSSRGALTEVNKLLIALIMECRQKNLFVFVVMPSFFLLDKYVALHRAKGLFHVYRKGEKRGYWVYFNKRKKTLLYLKGHNTYSYGFPKSSFKGRFLDQYAVTEADYKTKKRAAFMQVDRMTRQERGIEHRNLLFWILNRKLNFSTRDIEKLMEEYGVSMAHSNIVESIQKQDESLQRQGYT